MAVHDNFSQWLQSPSARIPLRCMCRLVVPVMLGLSGVAMPARAQIADQVVVFGKDFQPAGQIARFDRKISLIGMTQTSLVGAGGGILDDQVGVAVNAQGRYWVPFDALNDTKVLRMESDGTLILPSINLQHNPNYLVTTPSHVTYVLTRIPLLAAGPLYALDSDGSVLWTNPAGPALFTIFPQSMDVLPSGELWLGGPSGSPFLPRLVQADPASGAVLQVETYPKPPGYAGFDVSMAALASSPDGSLWAFFATYLTHLEGLQVVQQAALGMHLTLLRVDASGNVLVKDVDAPEPNQTHKILRVDADTLSVFAEYPIGGVVTDYGFALGPSGEDLYVSGSIPPDYKPRLWRVNLATGTKSSVGLSDLGQTWDLPRGDPTGFIWANVKDQQGDADGDGAPNRLETLSGSNPFDPASRPEGPKVYVSFVPVTNALVVTWADADGLFDPHGGLDLSTLSVTLGNFGNVFYFLLPFATALDLSADTKVATLTFGALPLPLNKKWEVEATISDLTGATDWDWQVTPPGDL